MTGLATTPLSQIVAWFDYHHYVPIYECPRCRGNDVYFGSRQEVKYTGGAYPEQYLANVQKALCRQCAEPMTNLGPTAQEVTAEKDWQEAKHNLIFSKTGLLLFSAALLLVGLVVWGIWTVVNDVVQCFDGYNYEIDPEGGYINNC